MELFYLAVSFFCFAWGGITLFCCNEAGKEAAQKGYREEEYRELARRHPIRTLREIKRLPFNKLNSEEDELISIGHGRNGSGKRWTCAYCGRSTLGVYSTCAGCGMTREESENRRLQQEEEKKQEELRKEQEKIRQVQQEQNRMAEEEPEASRALDDVALLERYRKLLDMGIISEEEYNKQKERILGNSGLRSRQ